MNNVPKNDMRRKDREMDAAFAWEVLCKAPYITVSMTCPDGSPYAVPLSLAKGEGDTFYFHGAHDGKKLECIAHQPMVCLSAVTKCKPTVGPKDDSFTIEFRSAIARGKGEIVTDESEKIEALRLICQRFLPHHMAAFDKAIEQSLAHTTVVRITLLEPPVGKRKEYDEHGEEKKKRPGV